MACSLPGRLGPCRKVGRQALLRTLPARLHERRLHRRRCPSQGAFEKAHGGTLFLDEVDALPLAVQYKLLRALEHGEVKPVGAARPIRVDVRVVAATHRDLLAWVSGGRFRTDLYYALTAPLPPLRSRREDIPLLAEHLVRTYAPSGQEVKFTADALDRLRAHSWPGNDRELRDVVCRALLIREGGQLEARDITFHEEHYRAPGDSETPELELPEGVTLEEMMQRVERQLIESALHRCENDLDRTAQELGLSRSSLVRKLKEWGLNSAEA